MPIAKTQLPDLSTPELYAALDAVLQEVPQETTRGRVDHLVREIMSRSGSPTLPVVKDGIEEVETHEFGGAGARTSYLHHSVFEPLAYPQLPAIARANESFGFSRSGTPNNYIIRAEVVGTSLNLHAYNLESTGNLGLGVHGGRTCTYTVPADAIPVVGANSSLANRSRTSDVALGYYNYNPTTRVVTASIIEESLSGGWDSSATVITHTFPALPANGKVQGVSFYLLGKDELAVVLIYGDSTSSLAGMYVGVSNKYGTTASKNISHLAFPAKTYVGDVRIHASYDYSNSRNGSFENGVIAVVMPTRTDGIIMGIFSSQKNTSNSTYHRAITLNQIPYDLSNASDYTPTVAYLSNDVIGVLVASNRGWRGYATNDGEDITYLTCVNLGVAAAVTLTNYQYTRKQLGGESVPVAPLLINTQGESDKGVIAVLSANSAGFNLFEVNVATGELTPYYYDIIGLHSELQTALRNDPNLFIQPIYSEDKVQFVLHKEMMLNGVRTHAPVLAGTMSSPSVMYMDSLKRLPARIASQETYRDTVAFLDKPLTIPMSVAETTGGTSIPIARLSSMLITKSCATLVDWRPVFLDTKLPVGSVVLLARLKNSTEFNRTFASIEGVSGLSTAIYEGLTDNNRIGKQIGFVGAGATNHPRYGGVVRVTRTETGWDFLDLL